jgi:acetyl-CoA carboxylase biotin carboxyl carrier protein
MSKQSSEGSEIFEMGRLRKLIELLREYDLNEIDLQDADKRIHIKRGGGQVIGTLPTAAMIGASPVPVSAAPAAIPTPAAEDTAGQFIRCPMVGTYYSKPKPDQPPFVKVGDVVSADTIVCVVEAMKMFNEIPAGVSGKIVEVCVKDGDAVDVNKPLFKYV